MFLTSPEVPWFSARRKAPPRNQADRGRGAESLRGYRCVPLARLAQIAAGFGEGGLHQGLADKFRTTGRSTAPSRAFFVQVTGTGLERSGLRQRLTRARVILWTSVG